MEMDQVDPLGLQPQQAADDAVEQRLLPPVSDARVLRMAALRKQKITVPPIADRLPDQFFAGQIALGRVDHVQPGIEGGC
jgi:hypothetical protein